MYSLEDLRTIRSCLCPQYSPGVPDKTMPAVVHAAIEEGRIQIRHQKFIPDHCTRVYEIRIYNTHNGTCKKYGPFHEFPEPETE